MEPPQQTPKRLSFAPLAAPVLIGPTVGCWCETSSDFDLLVELIAHVLADKGGR